MDAFFASVEQRDTPEFKGKPLVVGGNPEGRGVVSACSYEARKFGIHSAMSCARAQRLCPHLIFVRPDFSKYKEVSRQIREIFHDYTDLVEPLSLDEAFLDVTKNKKEMPSATYIAEEIRARVFKTTGLTCSAGVSFNKFLAKIASDENKPNGIKVITPKEAPAFIDSLPIRKFFGVGKATEKKMFAVGIKSGADLKKLERVELLRLFGKAGGYFHDVAHAKDRREVNPSRKSHSIGKETTLTEDSSDLEEIIDILERVAQKVAVAIKKSGKKGKTITLKVKYSDFSSVTRSETTFFAITTSETMMEKVKKLLTKTEAGERSVRLLGITLSNFEGEGVKKSRYEQMVFPFSKATLY
ncbi:DNA polymerase IV [bacterium]|nr:DNA polymerase IV [bacterium]